MSDEKRIDGEFHYAVRVVDTEWIEDAHGYHETTWGEVRRKDDDTPVDWLSDDLEGANEIVDYFDDLARHFIQAERERIRTAVLDAMETPSHTDDDLIDAVKDALSNPTNGENA